MTQDTKDLLQKALSLPDKERAELAGNLLASLDAKVDVDADVAWQEEITRRMREVESGRAKTVSWDKALQKGQSLIDGK